MIATLSTAADASRVRWSLGRDWDFVLSALSLCNMACLRRFQLSAVACDLQVDRVPVSNGPDGPHAAAIIVSIINPRPPAQAAKPGPPDRGFLLFGLPSQLVPDERVRIAANQVSTDGHVVPLQF